MGAILVLGLLLATAGCSTPANRRVARDAYVAAISPVQAVGAGAQDTYRLHKENPRPIFVSPVILAHHTVKHALVCSVYAGDLLYYPVALATDGKPLEIYSLEQFPFSLPEETGRKISDGLTIAWVWTATAVGSVYFVETLGEYMATHDVFSLNYLGFALGHAVVRFGPIGVFRLAAEGIDPSWYDRVHEKGGFQGAYGVIRILGFAAGIYSGG